MLIYLQDGDYTCKNSVLLRPKKVGKCQVGTALYSRSRVDHCKKCVNWSQNILKIYHL